MNLKDFLEDESWNSLRREMGGAELAAPVEIKVSGDGLTMEELDILITGGIDIGSLDEIRILDDGTLAYKDRRIILYIRNIAARAKFEPRFHVSDCFKLKEMRQKREIHRYVVAGRKDGKFELNITGGANPETVEKTLKVCQYCLGELKYRNFSHNDMSSQVRRQIVEEFTPSRFFELWPEQLE